MSDYETLAAPNAYKLNGPKGDKLIVSDSTFGLKAYYAVEDDSYQQVQVLSDSDLTNGGWLQIIIPGDPKQHQLRVSMIGGLFSGVSWSGKGNFYVDGLRSSLITFMGRQLPTG